MRYYFKIRCPACCNVIKLKKIKILDYKLSKIAGGVFPGFYFEYFKKTCIKCGYNIDVQIEMTIY
jgi:hypothetical protein